MDQVYDLAYSLVKEKMPEETARELARSLSDGHWTHDYHISFEQAKKLGFPVSENLPKEIHELMDLYPQYGQRRTSVEFIPPYQPPGRTP